MQFLSKDGKFYRDKTSGKFVAVPPPPSSVLNDNDWATIRRVSDAGTGANYWQVGDTKTIVINGTVGKTTFDNLSIDCFILGFNHNAAKEGNNRIHFGIGKSGDKLVGLVDSSYQSFVSETGYFSMNSSVTNVGGWKDCQLRNNVLQGTGTPTAPTAHTMLAALPADLRAIMKSVIKYTDNVGGGNGSVESNITATTDYLFIPAKYEIVISNNATNTYEQAQQAQYEYWKNGNSIIVYKYNNTSTATYWWLRSPIRFSVSSFCWVDVRGNLSDDSARDSLAILPCFCV